MPDDSAALPAPGWFPHPSRPGSELYWDGAGWTDRSRPSTPPMPVYGTPSAAGAPAADGSDGQASPYAAPSSTARNPMAVASLVLGLVSIPAGSLLVPSILAIVFGVRGRAAAARAGGGGLATAGLVIGIITGAFELLTGVVRLAGLAG